MGLRLGDIAPNFQADTTKGHIDFHEWIGDNWCVLYSHPADFTPVCTTEIGRTAKLAAEFASRGVKPIVVSVDNVEDHKRWILDVNDTQGVDVQFPIIGDEARKVAELYDMIHPNASEKATVRSVFIIDPKKKIRTIITYPPSTGRNFDEILRVIDSLQLTDGYSVATPVDWKDGEDVVVSPAISTADARLKFPKGVTEIRPYLRMTPQPNK
jgi:alkyl hydroperoxide reductase subunit AhpC